MDIFSALECSHHHDCLLCRNKIQSCEKNINPELLEKKLRQNLFAVLSKCMKWEIPSNLQFNFEEELFPFCKPCSAILMDMTRLDERVSQLLKEMDLLALKAASKIILSENNQEWKNKNNYNPPGNVTRLKLDIKSNNKKSKVLFCRNLTLKQYLPNIPALRTAYCKSVAPKHFQEQGNNSEEDEEQEDIKLFTDPGDISVYEETIDYNSGDDNSNTFENSPIIKDFLLEESSPQLNSESLVDMCETVLEVLPPKVNLANSSESNEATTLSNSALTIGGGMNEVMEDARNKNRVLRTKANTNKNRFYGDLEDHINSKFVEKVRDNNNSPPDISGNVFEDELDIGDREEIDDSDWGEKRRRSGHKSSRIKHDVVKISETQYKYRDYNFSVLENGYLKCEHCFYEGRTRLNIVYHIRYKHICNVNGKPKLSEVKRNRLPIVQVKEDEYLYGGKYSYRKVGEKFHCGQCSKTSINRNFLTKHIRDDHMRLSNSVKEEGSKKLKHKQQRKKKITDPNILPDRKKKQRKKEIKDANMQPGQVQRILYKPKWAPGYDCSATATQTEYYYEKRENDYKCGHCDHISKARSYMKYHVRYSHVYNKKVFVCEVCGKSFNIKILLEYHQRAHSSNRDYICETCGKSYKTHQSLGNHVRLSHPNKDPNRVINPKTHACDICGKTYRWNSSLFYHKANAHSSLQQSGSSGEVAVPGYNFTCHLCGKTLPRHAKTRHMRSHNDEKFFPCPECSKRYTSRTSLTDHMNSQHQKDSKSYNCELCDASIKWKASFWRHMRSVHGVTVNRAIAERTNDDNNDCS